MMLYSINPRDLIFAKAYGSLSFTKIISISIGKSIHKHLIDKYSQRILDHTKQSATD